MFSSKTKFVINGQMKVDLVLCTRFVNNINTNIVKAYCSNVPFNYDQIRRGTGGRSSFSGIVATVFGGTGFFGKYIINQLGKIGSQVIIPYRGSPYSIRNLRVQGDIGQILFVPIDPKNDDDIRKSVKYSNVVINLIGKDTETSNYTFEQVHIDIAARIARISKEMGVEKLIHMSALNASPKVSSFITKDGSKFLRTKGLGEIDVRREFPNAIIFRPSDMYGHLDRFLLYLQRAERRLTWFNEVYIPLWKYGKETYKQPVFAGDVAKGMAFAVMESTLKNVVIEAVGPHRYRLDHLLMWIYMTLQYSQNNIHIVNMNKLIMLKAKFHEMIKPKYPVVSIDKLERDCVTDLVMGLPSLEDLNVNLTNLEDRIFYELRYLRKKNYYWSAIGEMLDVPPPPRAVY